MKQFIRKVAKTQINKSNEQAQEIVFTKSPEEITEEDEQELEVKVVQVSARLQGKANNG